MNSMKNGSAAETETPGIWEVTTLEARSDKHRQIASEWVQRALQGIKEMHQNAAAREAVERRLF